MKIGLVLVPGLLCDEALWASQLAALSDVARCWVAGPLLHNSMAGMAQAVLRDAPFERFALAGLSMGGYVCMEIMRQAPQRVTALALLDTRAAADTAAETQRRYELIRLAQRSRGFQPVTRLMMPLLVHRSRQDDESLLALVRTMAERVGIEQYVQQQHAIISREDSRGVLKNVRIPGLVLCGEDDALTPLADHREMAGLIPAAELVVIERCGHLSALECPQAVSAALRHWLTRVPT